MFLLIHPRQMDQGNHSTSRPLKWGHLFLVRRISNPSSVLETFLWLLPSQGAVIHNPVGTNLGAFMLLRELKMSVISLSQEVSIPPNKVGTPLLTPTNQGGTTSILAKWVQIPNRGCISFQTSSILECLKEVLGCMVPNIHINSMPRIRLHLQSYLFWRLSSCLTYPN
jgi:hypothetical protein